MSATTTSLATISRPAARPGFALGRITITELKLIVREPGRMIRLLIPFVLMVIFGSIPFYTQHKPSLGGYSLFDDYLPILIAYALGMTGLTGLSTVLAGYREKGVLRRLRTTPVGPVRVLAAQLISQLALVAVMVVVIIAAARLGYGVFLPRQVGGFIVAALLAAAALLAIGLLVAAVARNSQSAQGIGLLLFFPLMFFAGLFFPIPVMPHVLQHLSHATPLGAAVEALSAAWVGHWPQGLQLWTLAAYAVACTLAAVRLMRWE
jgi:ABC-2 type transport system permease protein